MGMKGEEWKIRGSTQIKAIQKEKSVFNIDQATVAAVEEIGTCKCNHGSYSQFGAVIVKRRYLDFMTVHEYDGLEKPQYKEDRYRIISMNQTLALKGAITAGECDAIREDAKGGWTWTYIVFTNNKKKLQRCVDE